MQHTYTRPPCFVSKQIADEAERSGEHDKQLTWETLTSDNQIKVIERLCALAETEAGVTWTDGSHVRTINLTYINWTLATDVAFCEEMVGMLMGGKESQASDEAHKKWLMASQELVSEAMDDYQKPPKGYTLEGLL